MVSGSFSLVIFSCIFILQNLILGFMLESSNLYFTLHGHLSSFALAKLLP